MYVRTQESRKSWWRLGTSCIFKQTSFFLFNFGPVLGESWSSFRLTIDFCIIFITRECVRWEQRLFSKLDLKTILMKVF